MWFSQVGITRSGHITDYSDGLLGNCLATVVVAKLENEFHLQPEEKAKALEIATPEAKLA